METIFIQIASYKDPELIKTIKDCIKRADHPGRLTFGICWQYADDENLGAYEHDPRFRIHKIHWKDAKGVGWARHICNGLYRYEDFTLQIDSHHRFDSGWDTKLINQWKECKHPKAILSGYPPGYEYNEDGSVRLNELPPVTMITKGFDYGFVPTFKSGSIPNSHKLKRPYRGSFIAAGFFFTIGRVCEDVPYLKEVYFTGEEIVYSIRLFTHGYRVFHPYTWVIWHLYERKGAQRHWTNFVEDETLKTTFDNIQTESMESLKGILSGDPKYQHLFGRVNSVSEFELYSGTSLRHRVVHPKQIEGKEPPFEFYKGWEDKIKPLRECHVNLNLKITDIPELDDFDFWYFGLHDSECVELHRDDIKFEQTSKRVEVNYTKNVLLREMPRKYILWPHSASKGWQERLVYDIPPGSISLV